MLLPECVLPLSGDKGARYSSFWDKGARYKSCPSGSKPDLGCNFTPDENAPWRRQNDVKTGQSGSDVLWRCPMLLIPLELRLAQLKRGKAGFRV